MVIYLSFFVKRVCSRLIKSDVYRRAAAAGMVISLIIGGLTIFGLLSTMCTNRRKRSKAWAPISL